MKNPGFDKEEKLIVRELQLNDEGFEYIVINEAYSNFKDKKEYCTSIRLLFNKDSFSDLIKRDEHFSDLEFKFKEFVNTKGTIIFLYRKEKINYREVLYYTTKKTAMQLRVNDLNKLFAYSEFVDITVKKDQDWHLLYRYLN